MSQKTTSPTPYDDVFRTLLEKLPRLMIPLINEVFGKSYDINTSIVQFRNEHVIAQRKVITDSHLYVGELSVENHHYHIECQSTEEDICLRVIEYDVFIALEGAKIAEDGQLHIQLPSSAVLYLRSEKELPDHAIVRLVNEQGEHIDHIIPYVKAQDYSLKEITAKKLFVLFPFYLFRYESSFWEIEHNNEKLEAFIEDYQKVIQAIGEGSLKLSDPTTTFFTLLDLAYKTNVHLLKKDSTIIKDRMDQIMGGELLKVKALEIYEEGKAEGLAEGKTEGILETLTSLVKKGILDIETAAKEAGMPAKDFKRKQKL